MRVGDLVTFLHRLPNLQWVTVRGKVSHRDPDNKSWKVNRLRFVSACSQHIAMTNLPSFIMVKEGIGVKVL